MPATTTFRGATSKRTGFATLEAATTEAQARGRRLRRNMAVVSYTQSNGNARFSVFRTNNLGTNGALGAGRVGESVRVEGTYLHRAALWLPAR